MLPTPCYVIADAHLGAASAENERALVQLLHRARSEAGSVVINGDLFEFWFEWKHVIPRCGIRVLGALAALVDAGVPVLWIAGNHDCWGGEVLTRDIGVTYHVGPWRGEIAGWRTLIEHGDGLREREDAPYRKLRSVLRHPWSVWAFQHLLHPDFATRLAMMTSHTSRNTRPRDGGAGLVRVAEARLAAEPSLDLYLFGHSHVSALARGAGGSVYANTGAFLNEPTFLRVTDAQVELCGVDGDAVTVRSALARRP